MRAVGHSGAGGPARTGANFEKGRYRMKVLNKFRSKRKGSFEQTRTLLAEKIRESLVSVLPIIVIVTLLCLFLVPMQPNLLLTFLIGALMIVVGMGLFSLGAERSMTVIGAKI